MKSSLLLLLTLTTLTAFGADPKPYKLNTCPVSGEGLGTMGKPYSFVKDGQEVKLCCKGCLKNFEKDSAKYLKEIAEKSSK